MRAQIWGWPAERTVRLDRGDSHQFGDVTVTATFARHDEEVAMTGDAVGFLLDVGGVRFWDVADSEYDARLRPMREEGIDVMLVPINGVGGNMNAHEAALLVWQVAPRIAVPMHYGMWPDGAVRPRRDTRSSDLPRHPRSPRAARPRCRCWSPGRSRIFRAS